MVTPANPDEVDGNIQVIEPEAPEEDVSAEGLETVEDGPLEEGNEQPESRRGDDGAPQNRGVSEAPVRPPPQVDQAALAELQQRRVAEQEQTWRKKVGQQARAYEQQLEQSGYMPEQAREQARRYVQQEQKFRKQDSEAASMVGYVQGRGMAAVHFLKKHGLAPQQVLDDLVALQKTSSPAEMEKEAIRMKNDRSMRAEIAQLKQGRVTPQTFDNSQGSAEASSNQDRLVDAYMNGDRSDAVVRAARKLTLGN